jgi:hypothetical protein
MLGKIVRPITKICHLVHETSIYTKLWNMGQALYKYLSSVNADSRFDDLHLGLLLIVSSWSKLLLFYENYWDT